jgi:hypothetical protein
MFALGLLAGGTYGGYWLTRWFHPGLRVYEQWLFAFVVGIITQAYVGLGLSYLWGFNKTSQLIAVAISLTVGFLCQRFTKKSDPLDDEYEGKPIYWLLILLGALLLFIGATTLTKQSDGTIWINNAHNYADIRLHIDYINNFISGQNIPMENPIFSGTSPSYPFLIDFFTAQLVVLGLPIILAINLVSILFLIALAGSLYCLSNRVIPNQRVASLAAFLLFTNGGLGFFTHFLQELRTASWHLGFFLQSPHDYSLYQDAGYYLGNVIITFFNPQRSLLFGFTLVMLILAELYRVRLTDRLRRYLFIGILIAFLPLVHTSSLLIVALFLPFFFIRDLLASPKDLSQLVKRWGILLIPLATFGLFLIHIFISQAGSLLSYLRFQPGWISHQPSQFIFWLNNAGIAIITVVVAIVLLRKTNRQAAAFLAYSFVLFLFANLIITQPWDFDNAKYLIYWYAICCIGLGYVVMQLWSEHVKSLAILLGFCLSITGALDLMRRMDITHNWYPIISDADLQQAAAVAKVIPPQSRVLSIGDKLDPITTNVGRRFVFGDDAWLWSHGIKGYKERSEQVHMIYRGDAQAESLIKKLGVDYIIISDFERERENSLNETFFTSRYTPVYSDTTNLVVYKVNK